MKVNLMAVGLTLMSMLVGAIMWLTQIFFTASANATAIEKMERGQRNFQEDVLKELREMNRRLAVIEGKLQ